jgi:hypothetical protein
MVEVLMEERHCQEENRKIDEVLVGGMRPSGR